MLGISGPDGVAVFSRQSPTAIVQQIVNSFISVTSLLLQKRYQHWWPCANAANIPSVSAGKSVYAAPIALQLPIALDTVSGREQVRLLFQYWRF